MKHFFSSPALLLFLFNFLAVGAYAQPCTNLPAGPELFLNNQSEVDNFQANYGPCTFMPPGKGITLNYSTATNLDGLNALTSIGGQLFIGFTPLEDVDGLSKLTHVDGNVTIIQNPNLKDLDGLRNLTTIGGGLDISSNPSLQHVDGLARLNSVATNFNIFGNASLTNLDGFCGITSVAGPNGQNGQFAIVNNSNLPECCAVSPFLNTFQGPVIIFGNLPGCNTAQEITSCNTIPPCSPLAVPAMGTWALILMALLLANIGAVSLQPALQLAGAKSVMPEMISNVMGDSRAFLRSFLLVAGLILLIFSASIYLFGYELMPFDLTGSLLSAGLIAFFLQLMRYKKA